MGWIMVVIFFNAADTEPRYDVTLVETYQECKAAEGTARNTYPQHYDKVFTNCSQLERRW